MEIVGLVVRERLTKLHWSKAAAKRVKPNAAKPRISL
jgi:hypothetical protein